VSQFEDNLNYNSSLPSLHLDDEQFTDLLLGATSPSISAHLKVCAQCQEEADRVSSAIGSFEQQSRLWAEREAATHPRIAARRPAYAWLLNPAPAWAAAAVVIALIFGLVLRSSHSDFGHPSQANPAVATVQPAAVSPATLDADNALLAAIDGELHADDVPSSSDYGLTLSERPTRGKSARRVSN